MATEPKAERIDVEVVYGLADRQTVVPLRLEAGATVARAIEAADLAASYPDLELDPKRVGIFGRRVSLDTVLRAGDRVEIYRPLLIDPKEVRRARARAQKS